ncbi:MAG: ABC transporter substrate-binding protein [Clostridiales bacterium]|nr:MAG: ABC transporter substrate-binding protein [Clostridiales bacterium]
MKLKRIIAGLSAAVLFCAGLPALSGCQGTDGKFTIGICESMQHEALATATKGFKDALTELMGDKVTFVEQNAQGDPATCATICNQFVSDGVDLIMANATAALQAAAAATNKTPILATSVTDYATALSVSDWTGKTGSNISGTSDLAPLDGQAQMLNELFPEAKNVGILYCSAEANSLYQVTKIQAMLEAMGYTCKQYTFTDSNDLQMVVTAAAEASDVIYVPTDNTAASNTGIINSVCQNAKVPVVAGEEGICKGCGVATLTISYYDIGYATGKMAYEILVNGKNPGDMEIETAQNVVKKYNKANAEALGLVLPEGYEAIATDE